MTSIRLFDADERIARGGRSIHPLDPSELEQVIDLERRSFEQPWSEDLVAREMEQPHSLILVAKEGEVVVAFVIVWVIFDEIHILNIAVEPALRRHGIARDLLEVLLDRGAEAGVGSATLEVRVSNEEAIGLYRSLGFEIIGFRKGYYADGEDAQVMRKLL